MIDIGTHHDCKPAIKPAPVLSVRGLLSGVMLLMLLVLPACGGGGSSAENAPTQTTNPPVAGNGTTVISGQATFDLVPHNSANNSLDYSNVFRQPVRGAIVELVDDSGQILAASETSVAGEFEFAVTENTSARIRVKAQMISAGVPGWNFTVVDNTEGGALYVLESGQFTAQGDAMTRNLNAPSGWGGASYTDTRAAGPFAILDTIYQAMQKVVVADPMVVLPDLELNWSVDNRTTSGDLALGEISTSFYMKRDNGHQIYLLGAANADTDEYDSHVVAHEFTHFLESAIGRSDSLGGSHGGGDRLDPRVAFSEGLGYAFAGIFTDDPNVIDTLGFNQTQGFNFNVESGFVLNPGWFSEGSVQAIVYDLYDSTDDGSDVVSLGFTPILGALTGEFSDGTPLTTMHAFAAVMKSRASAQGDSIDQILKNQSIDSQSAYGHGESNNARQNQDVLPIYTELPLNGSPVNICSNTTFGTYNKLSNRRLFHFTVPAAGVFTVTASGGAGTDPDLVLHRGGILRVAQVVGTSETLNQDLAAGDYVLELYEYSNITDNPLGRTCFDVTASINQESP